MCCLLCTCHSPLVVFQANDEDLMHVQAAVEKDKAAHSTAPKRPSFKRPTVKRPAPAVTPTEEVEAGQASKKPRLDTLFQQSSVQSSKPHEHVTASTDASQAWSPTQHTDLPYSPGNTLMHLVHNLVWLHVGAYAMCMLISRG